MKTEKQFLITGHPRCGTAYMAKLFQSFGFDVQHERMGKDGISSWLFAPPEETKIPQWGGGTDVPNDYQFNYIVQCIRHPIKAISSIYYTEGNNTSSVKFRNKFLPLDKLSNDLERATFSYMAWNDLITVTRQPHLIVPIEDAPNQLKTFFEKHAIEYTQSNIDVPTTINARQHKQLTLDDILNSAPHDEARGIIGTKLSMVASQFGYKL